MRSLSHPSATTPNTNPPSDNSHRREAIQEIPLPKTPTPQKSITFAEVVRNTHVTEQTHIGEKSRVENSYTHEKPYVPSNSHRKETICIEMEVENISKNYEFKEEHRYSLFKPNEKGTRPYGPHGHDILFNGANDEFSNLYHCSIPYRGDHFNSVEHAYQATSAIENNCPELYSQIRDANTSIDAMYIAKEKILKTYEWEQTTQYIVMWELLLAKFNNVPAYKERLLSTGKRRLVERTAHREWGGLYNYNVKRNGLNHLGRMHMQIRDQTLCPYVNTTSENTQNPHTGEESLLIIGTSHVRNLSTKKAGITSLTMTYAGSTIPYIKSRIQHILKGKSPPMIFLQLGGVDCDLRGIDTNSIIMEYNSLIENIKCISPNSLVMLGQIPVRQSSNSHRTNGNIGRVNNFLKNRCLRGDGVVNINILPSSKYNQITMRPDGIHYNRHGKEEMCDKICQSVSYFLQK